MEKSTFPNVKEIIKARAYSLGFCLCGFTHLAPPAGYPHYQNWIEQGQHGDMSYLASEFHTRMRQNPQELAPWAKSLVFVAWPYPLNRSSENVIAGQVAGYVGQKDYHEVLPALLSDLMRQVQAETGICFEYKVFTDSAPILERELANRAGLGWIGKNSCLISPSHGSAFLLAEIFVEIELEPDRPFSTDHCGTCQRCIQACPTHCIQPDRTLDASRCISTLTVENKTKIPADLVDSVGNHLFGCDVCQAVCPWNRFSMIDPPVLSFSVNEMIEMLQMDESDFQIKFQAHPIRRAKLSGWLRNLSAILGNLKIREAMGALKHLARNSKYETVKIAANQALMKMEE